LVNDKVSQCAVMETQYSVKKFLQTSTNPDTPTSSTELNLPSDAGAQVPGSTTHAPN
jgi:hypothetical protein